MIIKIKGTYLCLKKYVFLLDVRSLQHLVAGRVALDDDGVQLLARSLDRGGVVVDDGDVVFFAREAFGKSKSDISSTKDENTHNYSCSVPVTSGRSSCLTGEVGVDSPTG